MKGKKTRTILLKVQQKGRKQRERSNLRMALLSQVSCASFIKKNFFYEKVGPIIYLFSIQLSLDFLTLSMREKLSDNSTFHTLYRRTILKTCTICLRKSVCLNCTLCSRNFQNVKLRLDFVDIWSSTVTPILNEIQFWGIQTVQKCHFCQF